MTNNSGEIFILNTNQKENSITKNTVLWIFSGQVYQAPINSFLNFYNDHKINKNNYIFRSKFIILESGEIKLSKNETSQFQHNITILNSILMLKNCNINKLYLLEKKFIYLRFGYFISTFTIFGNGPCKKKNLGKFRSVD